MQRVEQLVQRDNLSASAKVGNDAGVYRVLRHTEFLTLKIVNGGQFFIRGECPRAVRADGQHVGCREFRVEFFKEVVGKGACPHFFSVVQVAVQEGPVGNQHRLVLAVHNRAHDDYLNGSVTHAVPQGLLVAECAGMVNLDRYGAVRFCLDLRLKNLFDRLSYRVGRAPRITNFDDGFLFLRTAGYQKDARTKSGNR